MGPWGEQNAEDALTLGKNQFSRGPFHNPLFIIIYKNYDTAYNTPILLILFGHLMSFFFFGQMGAPLQVGALGTCL